MPKSEIQINREEHDEAILAKKVSMVSAATVYAVVNTGAAALSNVTVEQGTSPWVTSPVGNVTINYLTSVYTSITSIVSATGNTTIFVPASSTKWVAQSIVLSALATAEAKIVDGAVDITGPIYLQPRGGTVLPFGPTGLKSGIADNAFVVNLNGAATISVTANVRFI